MAYTDEQIESIFKSVMDMIEEGMPLRQILRLKDMPSTQTFYRWLKFDEEKSKRYARSSDIRADQIFDEMFDIADNGTNDYTEFENSEGIKVSKFNPENVQRSRLRIDTRKWALSKMNPKKYGDKLDLSSGGEKITAPSPLIINVDGKELEL